MQLPERSEGVFRSTSVQTYEIFGRVIAAEKLYVTVELNSDKSQRCCLLKNWLPIERADIFYGVAIEQEGQLQLLTDPRIKMSYSDEVMQIYFRKALGVKFGMKVYNNMRMGYRTGKEMSDDLDLASVRKSGFKPPELSWKAWRKLLYIWKEERAYRQVRVWGLTEQQIETFLHLVQCTVSEMLHWVETLPEAIFTLNNSQCISIRERCGLKQHEEDRRLGDVCVALHNYLLRGYLSMSKDDPILQNLSQIQLTKLEKNFPVVIIDDYWYLRYPGTVVSYLRKFFAGIKGKSVRTLPPLAVGEFKVGDRLIKISAEQARALSLALTQAFTVITGPAGTGKTTLLRALYNYCMLHNFSIFICAFTGKATARLREVLCSDFPCTLDLLCQKANPGTLEADFLAIDESSQVSMELFYRVIRLFKTPPQVILIGDPNQLAPISWGPLLDSILACGLVPQQLTEIHRYGDQLLINPHLIIQGLPLQLNSVTYLFPAADDQTALHHIKTIFKQILSKPEWSVRDVTVATPYNTAAEEVNAHVANMLFNNWEDFCVGDRIVMKDNAYDVILDLPGQVDPKNLARGTLFNGEEGLVTALDDRYVHCRFGDKPVKFLWVPPDQKKKTVKLAFNGDDEMTTNYICRSYALTVDRIQGSEYAFIIVYMPPTKRNSTFVDRRRLYTAVTRAKEVVFLVGNLGDFNSASSRYFVSNTEYLGELS